MKATVSLALALCMASVPAYAISRYNSQSMSCSRIQSVIRNEGAVILRYRSARNPSLPLYDRYVAHDGFCDFNKYAAAAWVPSSDSRSCPVLVCKDIDYDDHVWRP